MDNKKQIISAILAVVAIALIAGCTTASDKTVTTGSNVTVDYTGWLENGSVFDTSNVTLAMQAGIYDPDAIYAPLNWVVGSGEIFQSFDDAVMGMKINQSKNITLTPDEAFGEYDPTLIQPVNMSTLSEYNITPYVNESLTYNYQTVRVVSIPNNTTVMIDFNHPLAGKTLKFELTVRDIEPGNSTAQATLAAEATAAQI